MGLTVVSGWKIKCDTCGAERHIFRESNNPMSRDTVYGWLMEDGWWPYGPVQCTRCLEKEKEKKNNG